MAQNGGKRPGAGRKKGVKNKLQVKTPDDVVRERIDALFAQDNSPTPLEFLIETYQDSNVDLPIRVKCAGDAAPFIHRKQPTALEHSGGLDITTKRVILEDGNAPDA